MSKKYFYVLDFIRLLDIEDLVIERANSPAMIHGHAGSSFFVHMDSFCYWEGTLEGHDYWQEVSALWKDITRGVNGVE